MSARAPGYVPVIVVSAFAALLGGGVVAIGLPPDPPAPAAPQHLSTMAWTSAQWKEHAKGIRTSYNPDKDLTDDTLTLVPGDPRWLDFVYWCLSNKVAEHQVEAYGGTGWDGPKGGVIFHWAPGSHWERDTLASFGFTLGHTIGEHRWTDTMFPDFFEKYGGVYGVNVKDRLAEIDPGSPKPWVDFLQYGGGADSPYYRYLFHREAVVDPATRKIYFIAGQGVGFSYTFERYYHEVREVMTDARAVDFFQMYDRLGPGFASRAWAHQSLPAEVAARVGYTPSGPVPAVPRYDPFPAAIEVPKDMPEADAMVRGKKVYLGQCAMCHGIQGNGAGFLASSFDVKPRDFRQGLYKFRSTENGELPTMADVEHTIRVGVPGTTMPAWGQFLSDQDIHDVARYLIVFSERFTDAWQSHDVPSALTMGAPPANLPSLVTRGSAIWKQIQCATCHGATGREGPGPAIKLQDDWGNPTVPANLTSKWSFRNGHEPQDVYRTIFGGFNGTPMPSFSSMCPSEDDRWALVSYILSLSPADRPVIHLDQFAKERDSRIGLDGHVIPLVPPVGPGR